MTQVDLSQYRNILLTDEEYSEEHYDDLKIILENCKTLFDPDNNIEQSLLYEIIDSCDNKLTVFSFISNTTKFLKDLKEEHVICVSKVFLYLDKDEMKQCAEQIRQIFYSPIKQQCDIWYLQINIIWASLLNTYRFFVEIGRFQDQYNQLKEQKGFMDYALLIKKWIEDESL